ncbi:hypothetical protein G8C92_20950 [Paenibacillus donghaensis]|uniref:hypothetical protein n=1 Tax=Paenibacillus donghaensis TaxID=414771 RepID=UPI0018842F9B|nr:hypothetical protein [Paenibacillus donghaensis]MBE9916491.1 hypothetical protein [Paenibacillus donghaensis]
MDFKPDNLLVQQGGFVERFRVHMLHQRVLDWGCAKATHDVTWDQDMPFSTWAERFTDFTAEWLS